MNTKIKLGILLGSPKQVAWAEKLRAEVLAYVLEHRAEIVAKIRATSAEFHDVRVNNIIARVKDETARKRKLEKENKRYEERLATDVFGKILRNIREQYWAAAWIYHFGNKNITVEKAAKMEDFDAIACPCRREDDVISRMEAAKIRIRDGRIWF